MILELHQSELDLANKPVRHPFVGDSLPIKKPKQPDVRMDIVDFILLLPLH